MGMDSYPIRSPPVRRVRSSSTKPKAPVPMPPPTAEAVLGDLLNPLERDITRCWPASRFCWPSWRWHLAVFFSKDPRVRSLLESKVDDAVTNAQMVIDQLLNGATLDELMAVFPMDIEALRLRIAPESRRRWELEARMLARQPLAEIALRMNLNPVTVEVYEGWFYNIGDKIEIDGYFETELVDLTKIANSVVPVEIIWKAVAYCGGLVAFEELLDRYAREEPEGSALPVWLRAESDEQWALGRWLFITLMTNLALPQKVKDHWVTHTMRSFPAEQSRKEDLERIQSASKDGVYGGFDTMWQCAPGAVVEV